MTDEAVLRKHALLDYTYDMEYQEKVLKNTDITPAQKERCEKRIEEDKKWIARLNSLARLDDGSYAGFDKAVTMAKLFDDSVIHYAEYVNGFHFKRSKDIYGTDDPGFAIAKADGRLYRWNEGLEFLDGDILTEGDILM